MSSIIDLRTSETRSLDGRAQATQSITDADVTDTPKLIRLLTRILEDVASLKRRFAPRVITYMNLDVDNTGTTVYRLAHGFGGPVAWWPVGWTTAAAAGSQFAVHASTTAGTLAFVSYVAGTVAIRVEELG